MAVPAIYKKVVQLINVMAVKASYHGRIKPVILYAG